MLSLAWFISRYVCASYSVCMSSSVFILFLVTVYVMSLL